MSALPPSVTELLFGYFLAVATGEDNQHKAALWDVVKRLRERDADGFLVPALDGIVPPPPVQPSESPADRYRPGYVYLLEAEGGLFKIGRTTDLKQRSKYFGLKLPFKVKLISARGSYDAVEFESELHAMFANVHVNGEWFRLDEPHVDFIRWLFRPESMRGDDVDV